MGPDANSIVTDDYGNAKFKIKLDYKLLEPGASPVVAEDLVEQETNRVGGGWLRLYKGPITTASLREVDGYGIPVVIRSTAQGLTIVKHPDFITHGHTPGVGGTDHFSGFNGDFSAACMGSSGDDDSDDDGSADDDSDDDGSSD